MRVRSGLVISATSVCLALALAETFLGKVLPVPDPCAAFKTGPGVNRYIKSEFPASYSTRTEAEPGLPGVTGVHTFSTNNMGFRGDPLVTPKPAGETRVFLVGGSSTECLYLDDSESLDRVLQNELGRIAPGKTVKVYNAGKSGDASDDHVSMIVHRIVHLSPDLLVVFCGINDLTRAIYGYDYLHRVVPDARPLTFLDDVAMAATELQIPRRIYRVAHAHDEKSLLEGFTAKSNYREKVRVRDAHAPSDKAPREDLDPYRENLLTIAGVAQAHGVKLVFMTQQTTWGGPDPEAAGWQWMLLRDVRYRPDRMDAAMSRYNDVMREVAATRGIPVYDLAREIPKTLDDFYDDVHFNVAGARTAGRGLASFLLEKGLAD
ncbi:MAG: SGNH/GDSL hydrolase family protein [Acidobacteriota bacterium]